jgi:uncharacterized OsmC-like protein
MKIAARIRNSLGSHKVVLETAGTIHEISIDPKESGFGSSVNGGEALFFALATCYCNDIYREAKKRDVSVERVEVEVEGEFPAEGAPAEHVSYRASVKADADEDAIRDLMRHTDTVAEIQNSLRAGIPVELSETHVLTT